MTKKPLLDIGCDNWKGLIINGSGEIGIHVTRKAAGQFALFAKELVKWNRKKNLTAITDPFDIAVKHFIDSAAVVKMINSNSSVLDIGSGGGFPGIVIKILVPSSTVTLVDSSIKKINFLKHIIRLLKLEKVEAVHTRIEKCPEGTFFFEKYDFITCRAFSDLSRFISCALPYIKENGKMIALKGNITDQELNGINNPGMTIEIDKYILPFVDSGRSIVSICSALS